MHLVGNEGQQDQVAKAQGVGRESNVNRQNIKQQPSNPVHHMWQQGRQQEQNQGVAVITRHKNVMQNKWSITLIGMKYYLTNVSCY